MKLKQYILISTLLIIALAILLPFASSDPDGLEQLISASGVQQQGSFWNGIMADYSVAVGNPYFSTLLAGIFGTIAVLLATFVLGKAVAPRKEKIRHM
jgi:hypothetical protein